MVLIPSKGGGGGFVVTVASSQAPAEFRANADFVCDGVADDVQIQAALDQVTAANEGGVVSLSEGNYVLAATVDFDSSNVSLIGSGQGTVITFPGNTVSPAMDMADTTARFRIGIEEMRFTSSVADNGTAINFSHFQACHIKNVSISNCLIGVDMNSNDTFYNVLQKLEINVGGVGSMCVRLDGGANHNKLYDINCRGDSNTVGILCGASGNDLYGIDAESDMSIAVHFDASSDGSSLYGPWIESTTTGVQADSGAIAVSIFGGVIKFCTNNIVDNTSTDELTIYGCEIEDAQETRLFANTLRLRVDNVTIASGAIAATSNYLAIAGEGGVSDTLNNITGFTEGDIVVCRAFASAQVITFAHNAGGAGTMRLAGATNFVTASTSDTITFIVRGSGTPVLCEISRSTNQ